MNKYFIQLFLRESTVILPGFGALTAPNGNLEEIMFVPYLTTDDGKLANFIAETEGVDAQNAQNTIAKFIREMEASLGKGETFDIFKFGSFSKNEAGEIEFKSWLKQKYAEEMNQKEEDVLTTESTVSTDDTDPTKNILFDVAAIEEASESANFSLPDSDESKAEEVITFVSEINAENKLPEIDAENETVEAISRQQSKPTQKSKKGTKKTALPWLLGASFVFLLSIGFYLYQTKIKGKKENPEIASQSNDLDTTSTVKQFDKKKEISPNKIEEKKQPEKKKNVKPNLPIERVAPTTKGFFIINGAFSSESSAQSKIDLLTKEGYKAKIIVQNERTVYVSLADFSSRSEASDYLKLQREKGMKVWILEK